jgi:hypothetical protein
MDTFIAFRHGVQITFFHLPLAVHRWQHNYPSMFTLTKSLLENRTNVKPVQKIGQGVLEEKLISSSQEGSTDETVSQAAT